MNFIVTISPDIIKKTEIWLKSVFAEDCTGHDYFHADRVRKIALMIAENYDDVDKNYLELLALLHDTTDWKFNSSESEARRKVFDFLNSLKLDKSIVEKLIDDISKISFKGGFFEESFVISKEVAIVQDSDRLDAIGAIGIARAFAFGGNRNRIIYDPQKRPEIYKNFEEYRKSNSCTINHFYEKLLLLKEKMKTPEAKLIAEKRHEKLISFLNQFFEEWNLKDVEKILNKQ